MTPGPGSAGTSSPSSWRRPRTPRTPRQVAERVLADLRPPFWIKDRSVSVHASIGIAYSKGGTEDPAELLQAADVAMYAAKARGKNCYEVYKPALQAAVSERLERTAELQRAVDEGEFVLHYQPIVSLDGGLVVEHELVVFYGPLKLCRPLQPLAYRRLQGRFVDLVTVLAPRFGRVHSHVGCLHQVGGILRAAFAVGDPDAGVDVHRTVLDLERGPQIGQDSLRYLAGVVGSSVSSRRMANSSPPNRAAVSPDP